LNNFISTQGGKNRRRGKNENDDDKRELVFREDGQEYAQVTKMLGNGRLEAMCFDGEKRLAHIRGKMRKKVSIRAVDSKRLIKTVVPGVDQPRRHRTSFVTGLPGRQGRCHRQVYG
jgi:initiation factor 1A